MTICLLFSQSLVHTSEDLTLTNLEALADNESTIISCYGVGSIDCPLTKTKVKFIE